MRCESFACNNLRAQPCVFAHTIPLREAFHHFEVAEPRYRVVYGYEATVAALRRAYARDPARFVDGTDITATLHPQRDEDAVVYVLFIQRRPHDATECACDEGDV